MQNADGITFTCHWCAQTFPRRHLTGRKPHYCTHTCRQRAYEARRRGARYPAHPYPATVPPTTRPPHYYEAGRHYRIRHALRPAGLPDKDGRRPTLCGAWAHTTRWPFGHPLDNPHPGRHCHTCQRIARQHPPTRHIDPPTDLAVVTHLVSRLGPHPDHHDLFTYLNLTPPTAAAPTATAA